MTAEVEKIKFVNHFVAFVDLLGFSEMVAHDAKASPGDRLFVEKLFEVNREIESKIASSGRRFSLTQFSDSIVISLPLDQSAVYEFISVVSSYQLLLLSRGLLCRGGISYGKHFSSGSFIFSDALITAYKLESQQAKFPRILVSEDLVQLFDIDKTRLNEILIREDDGAVFVNYLKEGARAEVDVLGYVRNVARSIGRSETPSVKEKIRWLTQYADFVLGTRMAPPRFENL